MALQPEANLSDRQTKEEKDMGANDEAND